MQTASTDFLQGWETETGQETPSGETGKKAFVPAGQSWSQEVHAQQHSGSKKVPLPVSASACYDLRAFKTLGQMTAELDLTGFPGLGPVFMEK